MFIQKLLQVGRWLCAGPIVGKSGHLPIGDVLYTKQIAEPRRKAQSRLFLFTALENRHRSDSRQ